MPALVQQASEEYKALSAEEKEALIEEYVPHRECKTFGLHATKLKVNDITGMLKAVEGKVCYLFSVYF